MCTCDDNYAQCYWESNRVARKSHQCCECGSEISKGETYNIVSLVFDGSFSTHKTCSICEKVRVEAYVKGSDCICFGELWETVGVEFESAAK